MLLKGKANYTIFILRDGREKVVAHTLKYFESFLQTYGFQRVHRSSMINPNYVKSYNEQMKDFVLSGLCGNIQYIDVYNMTNELKINHRADALYMTFDKAHWGMEVNLAKAQLILTEINENPSITFVQHNLP